MARKKNYKILQSNIIPMSVNPGCSGQSLIFNSVKGIVDFNRWNYYGRPDAGNLAKAVYADREVLVTDLFNAISQLSFEMSKNTVEVLAAEGCKQIFQFIDYKHTQGVVIDKIEDFTSEVIEDFLIWIRNKPAKTTSGKLSVLGARRHYTSVKSILSYFIRQGRVSAETFPYAPFVNVNRSGKGTAAYSKSEMSRIMRFLWQQLALIRKSQFIGPQRQMLAVYALIIAAKTGRNTSTILNLKADCISPHPLAPNTHIILTGFKKRGMNTSVQAMRSSHDVVDTFATIKDIGTLVAEVTEITHNLRHTTHLDTLFLYSDASLKIKSLSEPDFWKAVQGLYTKASLQDDKGEPLKIQIKRMRKTFAGRVWQLTGGDPVKTAKVLGNTVPVLDKHYLAVTPEMERKHKMFGHVLTESLLSTDGDLDRRLSEKLNVSPDKVKDLLIGNFNTTVGRCSDPINGKFSKGDGTACGRFARCFTCPNQVVVESDLYRLFSFYWLILSEKGLVGRKKWKMLYANIINVIDTEISEAFDADVVDGAKEKARLSPHPAWRSRRMLEVL